MLSRRIVLFVLNVLPVFFLATIALAETVNCTAITALPATISSTGVYCLTGNLSTSITSGAAITINAGFVVLDLNGWSLTGTAANSAAIGIKATSRKNINVKNGTIRGFQTGIWFDDTFPYTTATGHVIEDLHVQGNKVNGILIFAQESVVRNNIVSGTGNSSTSSTTGIYVAGPGCRVLNNEIIETTSSSSSFSIAVDVGGANTLVINNHISNASYGIVYDSGASGKYRDNLTTGVTAGYSGGTDAGNNN